MNKYYLVQVGSIAKAMVIAPTLKRANAIRDGVQIRPISQKTVERHWEGKIPNTGAWFSDQDQSFHELLGLFS